MNENNPLKDLAEEKFKEIQWAYDEIMNGTSSNSSYGSSSYTNYSNSNDSYSKLSDIRQKIKYWKISRSYKRIECYNN